MSKSIVASAASRCCNQLQLANFFSSAMSLSSPSLLTLTSTSTSTSTRAFSKAAFTFTTSRASIATRTKNTTILAMANNSSINTNSSSSIGNNSDIVRRSMAINRKVIDAKNARRLKIQQKKKKNANKVRAFCAVLPCRAVLYRAVPCRAVGFLFFFPGNGTKLILCISNRGECSL
uniref:Uncharacterized protein n=1 Tax=Pseudo-nitzschia australis TaxID=44445 RepID=A0A7S4AIP4_9STRA